MAGKFGEHNVQINKSNGSKAAESDSVIKAKPLNTVALKEGFDGTSEFFVELNSKKNR